MKATNSTEVDDGIYPGEAYNDTRHFESVKALVAPDHDKSMDCNRLEQPQNKLTVIDDKK